MTIPSLALMLVIDKSDSMGGYIGDAQPWRTSDTGHDQA